MSLEIENMELDNREKLISDQFQLKIQQLFFVCDKSRA